MALLFAFSLVLLFGSYSASVELTFPQGFMLGTGSSSFQTEGAWNESGKGPSIWDTFTHLQPDFVSDSSNADVASDSFHKYREDVQLIKELGMNFYRFSISWPRILPKGHVHIVNQEGINYYNSLINELKDNDIEPVVTMYHWDLPQNLQLLGGWANPIMADYFEDYAHLLFIHFGDRVKWWITIHDPKYVADGYGSNSGLAPAVKAPGIGEYMAMHNILIGHANAYRLYDSKFRKIQQGKVGISIHAKWYEPVGNREVNIAARDRLLQFSVGIYAHPIFSPNGDYPVIVKERVARKSKEEGFARSRLVYFTEEEIKHIQGSSDFFGLGHMTTKLVEHDEHRGGDVDVETSVDTTWPSTVTPWFRVAPWGFRKLLNWIKDEYDNPPVFVTENGFPDLGDLHDMDRAKYFINYMAEMLRAVHENGCNVIGYTAWSLLDSFEWREGYTEKYGLFSVNFSDPLRRRIAKDSAYIMSHISSTRQLPQHLVHTLETSEPNQKESVGAASYTGISAVFISTLFVFRFLL